MDNSAAKPVTVTLAALVIIFAAIQISAPLIVPLLLATLLAFVCNPLVTWLSDHKVPHGLAVAIVVLGFFVLIALLGGVVGASLTTFSSKLPMYQQKLIALINQGVIWLNNHGVSAHSSNIQDYLDPSSLIKVATSSLKSFGSTLGNTFLILFTVIFFLQDAPRFREKIADVAAAGSSTDQKLKQFSASVHSYLGIKTFTSLITGVLVSLWLYILGVDYPILLGLLAFLLNFIPTIGSIIAALPAVLLALLDAGLNTSLVTAGGFVVINLVIGNVVEPRMMGQSLGLSTLVVFISLVFWGWLLGPVGMLLSIPLTMVAKLALEADDRTQWLAHMLGK